MGPGRRYESGRGFYGWTWTVRLECTGGDRLCCLGCTVGCMACDLQPGVASHGWDGHVKRCRLNMLDVTYW